MTGNQHSALAITASVVEATLLVFLGIAAAHLDSPFAWLGIVMIVIVLVVTRYLAGSYARQDASRAWFAGFIEDSTNLQDVIREITDHNLSDPWTKPEMVEAIEYWYLDDLYGHWMWNEYLTEKGLAKKDSPAHFTRKQKRRLAAVRHPLKTVLASIQRLERKLVSKPSHRLIRAVRDLSYEEIATMVIKQGVEKGFIIEEQDRDDRGRVVVAYRAEVSPDLKAFFESQ